MPRMLWLVTVFVISLVVWLARGVPAQLAVRPLDGLPLAGHRLELAAVQGYWWRGQAAWQWRETGGHLAWQLEWRGLRPGVRVAVDGGLEGEGWLTAGPGSFSVAQTSLRVPGALIARLAPALELEGTVSARDLSFRFSDNRVTDAAGRLAYTGGTARWGRQRPVQVQPLSAEVQPTEAGLRVLVTSADGAEPLARAELAGNTGTLTVLRAWASMLGISQGGNPGDVIFETSLPLWQQ